MKCEPIYSLEIRLPVGAALELDLMRAARESGFGLKLADGEVYNCQCEECRKGRAKWDVKFRGFEDE